MTLPKSICDLLGIEVPVVLAGMGGASTPRLAAAVSNAGGLGILGAGNTEYLRNFNCAGVGNGGIAVVGWGGGIGRIDNNRVGQHIPIIFLGNGAEPVIGLDGIIFGASHRLR